MKTIFLIQFILCSLIHIQDIKFSFPINQHEIFFNYSNKNFSQKLLYEKDKISAEIKSSNPIYPDLNLKIILDKNHMENLNQELKDLVTKLYPERGILKNYFSRISAYLKKNIKYSNKNLPQDAVAVILNKKANCIGYSNLVSILLKSVKIKHKLIKGFYLKKEKDNIFQPIPHRWIEINLPNEINFFYDPQYQNFSANYIMVKENVNFKKIKKFKVYLMKKSRKIIN